MNIVQTLNQILLDKVSYETDIPTRQLLADNKFKTYWDEYCQTTEDTWTLNDVIEYALELAYSGEHFSDNLWAKTEN